MKKIVALLLTTLLLVGLCFALASCGECKHTYGDPSIKAPTCTADGSYTYTCTKCGETKVEAPAADDTEMLKLGHTEDEGTVITAATCTTDGLKEFTCVDCGETLREVTLDASGHLSDAGVVTTMPSCTEAGVRTFTCVNLGCGAVIGTEVEPALGHSADPDAWETDGTNHYNVCDVCEAKLNSVACTFELTVIDDEKHASVCSVCAGMQGAAANHEFGAEQTIPASTTTCQAGKTYKVCATCEHEIVIAVLPGVGEHVYAYDPDASEWGEEDHSETHEAPSAALVYGCVNCDDSYTINADYALAFDGCLCGWAYDPVKNISDPEKVVVTTDGCFEVKGAVNANHPEGPAVKNNLDLRMLGELCPMSEMGTTVYVGFDLTIPEGGLPESGLEMIFKIAGTWSNPNLHIKTVTVEPEVEEGLEPQTEEPITKNVVIFDGVEVEFADNETVNIVLGIQMTAGNVAYDAWVNGQNVAPTRNVANAAISSSTQWNSGSWVTYGGLKIPNSEVNLDWNRGVILDNVFWTEQAPTFVK